MVGKRKKHYLPVKKWVLLFFFKGSFVMQNWRELMLKFEGDLAKQFSAANNPEL